MKGEGEESKRFKRWGEEQVMHEFNSYGAEESNAPEICATCGSFIDNPIHFRDNLQNTRRIVLLPGLSIYFKKDGAWLNFSGQGHDSIINIHTLADRCGTIGGGIEGWLLDIRNNAISK